MCRASGSDNARCRRTTLASNAPSGPAATGRWNAAWRTRAPMRSRAIRDFQPVEPGNAVDVDQMRRARQAKGHDRHQALTACEDPPFLRRQFGEQRDCFRDRRGAVIGERRGLHRATIADALRYSVPPRTRIGRTEGASAYRTRPHDGQAVANRGTGQSLQFAPDPPCGSTRVAVRPPRGVPGWARRRK